MTDFLQIVQSLREQMHATLARSDVLRALIWPIGILMTATLGLTFAKAPDWLLIVFAVLVVLSILLYGAAYTFCLINDRDALRSEKYSLHKMAIEHGVYGDSRIGLIEPDPVLPNPVAAPQIASTAKPESQT
jgi:hypothetical protein